MKQWQPDIVDTQLLKIGQFVIAAVPGEFTTMSGRRLRATIRTAMQEVANGDSTKVVISGLSNAYTQYVTTFEEYQKQRYEAASTLYGPYTLMAYQQQYSYLAKQLALGEPIEDEGPRAPTNYDIQVSFVPGVIMDNPPLGHDFGDCLVQVNF